MRISVMQHHIDAGVRGSCTQDPIALALKDAGFIRPWVNPVRIRIEEPVHKEFALPDEVYAFMLLFDTHKTVEPFEFELEEK